MSRRARFDPQIDYYSALGVKIAATAEQIQAAFRQRAKELHPDRNSSAEATRQFQQLSEAYAILSDPILRAEYDSARERAGLRSAFEYATARRAKPPVRDSGPYWVVALRGLWRSNYRYVFVLLGLVTLSTLGFFFLSQLVVEVPVSAPTIESVAPTTAAAPTVEAAATSAPPTPSSSAELPGLGCDSGLRITAPADHATVSGSFELIGYSPDAYQVEWASAPNSAGPSQALVWQVLSVGEISPANGVLAASVQTDVMPRPARVFLRLATHPADKMKAISVCQISVQLENK